MKPYTTADRLKQIMRDRNMKQVDILRAVEPFCLKYGVKLGKNALSQYVSGKAEPGSEKLTILGLGLNVSEPWLMGYDVSPARKSSPSIGNAEDERVRRISDLASCLTAAEQDQIISQIEWLLSRR